MKRANQTGEFRSPKSEVRKKTEVRNPKQRLAGLPNPHIQVQRLTGHTPQGLSSPVVTSVPALSAFGFRISFGSRISVFGFLSPLRWASGAALLSGLVLLVIWLALPLVPLPAALFAGPAPELQLLDRNGQPLRVVRPGDGAFHRPIEYGEIPQPLIQATLAAEDRRFWRHPGVDWRATARAAWQFLVHRHVVSGGSTITQQLIKLAEPRRRSLPTKLIEAMQALRLEAGLGQTAHSGRIPQPSGLRQFQPRLCGRRGFLLCQAPV